MPALRPALLAAVAGLALACTPSVSTEAQPARLPYAEAGLTEREAAAFLLDRLAFGPRPGDVDAVVAMGLDAWVDAQLAAALPEPTLDARLADLVALDMDLGELSEHFVSVRDAIRRIDPSHDGARLSREDRTRMRAYLDEHGLQLRSELNSQLPEAKLRRALYAENQLREVLTDFWFNHFNVNARGIGAAPLALAYERDAIRPHVLGSFRDLLGATAHHPAMLAYLDNVRSRAPEGRMTALGRAARGGGLNENYARELMELHTLGVDGGYTQTDVQEVARAFTGWTVIPFEGLRDRQREQLDRMIERAEARGVAVVRDGSFLFRPDWHDAEAKTVLGTALPAGRGIEDGEAVLDLLARHPSTAHHIARKLAVRFVADDPDEAFVRHLADVFIATDGDLTAVMRALVEDPAFWSAADGPTKVKTPFELVTSALRATGAEVEGLGGVTQYLQAMGEPVFFCEPPTGFPDHASAWVNPGALLTRMRFGLQLAQNRLRGVEVDLAALNGGREPASAEDALQTYAALLLPGRDLGPTLDLLTPLVRQPDLAARVDEAARQANDGLGEEARVALDPDDTVAYVVGVILGSPSFQRQ